MASETYSPSNFGQKEVDLINTFNLQHDDAKRYFESVIKPRLDRSYKLYISDNSDRSKQIKSWQANVSVPYIHSVVETLKPRILDARPEFSVQGRNPEDQAGASKLQSLNDYTWEISKADTMSELITSSALIYGTGFMQASWKKDVRKLKFLKTKKVDEKKYTWEEKKETFYDAPYVEWVDNYSLWYDWHNIEGVSKQYWLKRMVLTDPEIKRRYPMADKKRLRIALANPGGDLQDYGSVRNEVKLAQESITKGADFRKSGPMTNIYENIDTGMKMYEVFEWYQPFEDTYAVMVNKVPILKGGSIPFPYNFKETPFIAIPYLRLPGEFEGYGLPMVLENPQIMLNMTKNQRLDAMTLNIHKMWIVNPLANISKEQLVMRPFGIVYSTDPNGAREIQMADIKPSAYKEEELLKADMRYSSGVDDFSMGVGGGTPSATEVRHLRESTLERVRLFVSHLGEGYSTLIRYWISMYKQFYTKKMIIRIVGDNGLEEFPIVEKDDLEGEYDYKATVLPSIAGQNDVKKKQDMDLFQMLIEMPFIDTEKLTAKLLYDWNWDFEALKAGDEVGPEQMMPGEEESMLGPQGALAGGQIPESVAQEALGLLGGPGAGQNLFAELGAPVDLTKTGGAIPPTPRGVGQTTNPRGLNRGGKVNTNIPLRETSNAESQLQNQATNIQR